MKLIFPDKVAVSGPAPPNNIPLVLSDAPVFILSACRKSPKSEKVTELKEPNFPNDFEERDNFFWMSSYAFKIAIKLYPSILNKHHSCGMGNTFEQIKEIIKNEGYLTPYLSYEHWLNKVEKSK